MTDILEQVQLYLKGNIYFVYTIFISSMLKSSQTTKQRVHFIYCLTEKYIFHSIDLLMCFLECKNSIENEKIIYLERLEYKNVHIYYGRSCKFFIGSCSFSFYRKMAMIWVPLFYFFCFNQENK